MTKDGPNTIPLRRPQPSRFEGRCVVVTGASDRGLGGAIVERFGREGARLVIADLAEPIGVLRRLERRDVAYRFVECDVTRDADVQSVVETANDAFGWIDILVNNAGVGPIGDFSTLADEDWQRAYEINVLGLARVTRTALPHLSSPGGVIVNVSSAMAANACRGYTIYGSTKAAVDAITKSLAIELAPKRIRVVGVAPALVHTPMIHALGDHRDVEARQRIDACHPLGMGSPHDVADAVAYLASDDAGWITGTSVPLGWTPQLQFPVDHVLDHDTENEAA